MGHIYENKKTSSNKEDVLFSDLNLDEQEVIFILNMIKNSQFKGEYVELLYNLTLKFQNYYKKLKNV